MRRLPQLALALLAGLLPPAAWTGSADTVTAAVDLAAYDQVRTHLAGGELVIFTAPGCGYCSRAMRWLNERDLPYAECDVQSSRDCADRFAAIAGRGVPTFLLQGRTLAGFSPQALERLVLTAR